MKQKFNKNVNIKKSMQNMLRLSVPCDLNADYPFLSLSKAFEILTSKRLVEFVVILSLYMLLVSWKSWSCTRCVAEPFYDEPASASTVSLTFTVYGTGTGSTVYTELE